MIAIATLNRHGQITIPAKIRKKFNIFTNQSVKIYSKNLGFFVEPIKEEQLSPKNKINNLFSKSNPQIPIIKSEDNNYSLDIDQIIYQ